MVFQYRRGKVISLNNLSNKSIKGIWRKVKEIAGAEPALPLDKSINYPTKER